MNKTLNRPQKTYPSEDLERRDEFLRPFRGVNKVYLEQYVIMFQWHYNLKAVDDRFLRIMCGCSENNNLGP